MRSIESHFRKEERWRALLYEESRRLRRLAQSTMSQLHEGRDVRGEIRDIEKGTRALAGRIRSHRRGEGIAHDALQEGVEAVLLDRIVRGDRLPSPRELGVGPEEYLAGLGDVVGEVRRLALASLASGDTDGASRRLTEMEALHRLLLRFEAPRAILALKPKQDASRAILERTRGDVALALVVDRAGLPPRGRGRR